MSHKYGVERDKPRLKTHKRERLNRCNGQAFMFKHGEAKMNMPILTCNEGLVKVSQRQIQQLLFSEDVA